MTLTISLVIIIILLVSRGLFFSSWDITGEVIATHENGNVMSLLVEENKIIKHQKYYITIDEKTEIRLNGEVLLLPDLIKTIKVGFKIKAIVGDITLYSDPPVVLGKIVELVER